MKTAAAEDVVAAATMMVTVAVVAGTMTEDTVAADVTTIAVVMAEDATMTVVEAVTMTGGINYRRCSRGEAATIFCLTLRVIPSFVITVFLKIFLFRLYVLAERGPLA
jgi:hypothetical protein